MPIEISNYTQASSINYSVSGNTSGSGTSIPGASGVLTASGDPGSVALQNVSGYDSYFVLYSPVGNGELGPGSYPVVRSEPVTDDTRVALDTVPQAFGPDGAIEVVNDTTVTSLSYAVSGNTTGSATPIPGASGVLTASGTPGASVQQMVSGYDSYFVGFYPVGGGEDRGAMSQPIQSGTTIQFAARIMSGDGY